VSDFKYINNYHGLTLQIKKFIIRVGNIRIVLVLFRPVLGARTLPGTYDCHGYTTPTVAKMRIILEYDFDNS
jgi:hypothetical protein